MNEELKRVFLKRLNLIISFLEKPTKYKYSDALNNISIEFISLIDFPNDLSLFLQDKELRQKIKIKDLNGTVKYITLKNELNKDIFIYIKERNIQWLHFTGDHCYPIPIKANVNTNYIPLYGWYRNKSDFYIKAKDLCIDYFKHLREPLL